MLVDESSTRPSSASKLLCPRLYFVPVSPAYQSNGRHAASRNRGALQHVSASIPRRSDRDSSEYCRSRQMHAGIDCVASYSQNNSRVVHAWQTATGWFHHKSSWSVCTRARARKRTSRRAQYTRHESRSQNVTVKVPRPLDIPIWHTGTRRGGQPTG